MDNTRESAFLETSWQKVQKMKISFSHPVKIHVGGGRTNQRKLKKISLLLLLTRSRSKSEREKEGGGRGGIAELKLLVVESRGMYFTTLLSPAVKIEPD